MINVEILGKFYDNHSLSIINRQLVSHLNNSKKINLFITPLDEINPEYRVDVKTLEKIKSLAEKDDTDKEIDVQI